MVQFLSIIFFSWISSIFVGFFKSSRFFCVILYLLVLGQKLHLFGFFSEAKFSGLTAINHATTKNNPVSDLIQMMSQQKLFWPYWRHSHARRGILNKVNIYGIAKCPLFPLHPHPGRKKIVTLSLIGLIRIICCVKKNVTDIFNRNWTHLVLAAIL